MVLSFPLAPYCFGPEIDLRDVCVARLGAVAPLAKQQNARSASGTGPASVGMTRTSVDAALPVNFRGFNEHLRGTPYGGGYSGAECSRAGRERCNPPAGGGTSVQTKIVALQ